MANDNQKLIDVIAPLAMQSQKKTGIPASVTIAQFIQESGWTLSTLATQFNNFFGVKNFNKDPETTAWMPTTEYENGHMVAKVEPFKKYASPADSFDDHASVLKRMGITGGDPYVIADQLQAAGYATDPDYSSALKSHIRTYNLTAYDSIATVTPTQTKQESSMGFWEGIKKSFGDLLGAGKGTITGNPNPDLAIDPSTGNIGVKDPNAPDGVSPVGHNPFSMTGSFSPQNITYVGVIIVIILSIIIGTFVTIKK